MRKPMAAPSFLPALVVVAGLALDSNAFAASMPDWSVMEWCGQSTCEYTYSAEVKLRITISTSLPGTVGNWTSWDGISGTPTPCHTVVSPNLDGPGGGSNRYGIHPDLGITYDPSASKNQVIYIYLEFRNNSDQPRSTSQVKFEISDIDWSHGGNDCNQPIIQGWRQDEVVITANNGSTHPVPTNLIKLWSFVPEMDRTFVIDGNRATAKEGKESNSDPNGTVVVDFENNPVTDVLIAYNEAGFDPITNHDPGYRGIGILGGSTSLPVELMDFTIE